MWQLGRLVFLEKAPAKAVSEPEGPTKLDRTRHLTVTQVTTILES